MLLGELPSSTKSTACQRQPCSERRNLFPHLIWHPWSVASEHGRTGRETAVVRCVAIPGDFDQADDEKADGMIELPQRIRWSGPPRSWDLADPGDRARVYEQVLREGNEADVRFYVRLTELIAAWDDLVLPEAVRSAWERWFSARNVHRAC